MLKLVLWLLTLPSHTTEQLGNDKYSKRLSAANTLTQLGWFAYPILQHGKQHKSEHVRHLCRRLAHDKDAVVSNALDSAYIYGLVFCGEDTTLLTPKAAKNLKLMSLNWRLDLPDKLYSLGLLPGSWQYAYNYAINNWDKEEPYYVEDLINIARAYWRGKVDDYGNYFP